MTGADGCWVCGVTGVVVVGAVFTGVLIADECWVFVCGVGEDLEVQALFKAARHSSIDAILGE